MIRSMLTGFLIDGKHSGIDKYLLGFCDAAREAGVRLDFLTQKIDPELRDHLASYGFGLLEIPDLKHPLRQKKAIQRILSAGNYDAVYLNQSESFNCMLLAAAAACKVPVRIAHSHSSGVDRENPLARFVRRFLHRLYRPKLTRLATRRLACSSVAGEWMFDRPFEIICNAVNADRFAFDVAARDRVRKEMDLGDRKVFIHIGNFGYQKDQMFLLDVMKAITDRDPDAILLLLGEGGARDALEEKTKRLGLTDNVRFLGVRTDVPALLSAADVFVFPSRFEGFSVTCLEAQFSGIPCLWSDRLAPETRIAENVTVLPKTDPALWADTALRLAETRSDPVLLPGSEAYDAQHNKRQLLSILKNEETK